MRACYPGSFDPVTLGHLDIIERAAPLCTHLTVAVIHNPAKKTLFTLEERRHILGQQLAHLGNVSVDHFSGLLVDFVARNEFQAVIRGLRDSSDAPIELQMARLNREMNRRCETLFLASAGKFSHLSSSFVREIARLGGPIEQLVTPEVAAQLQQKLTSKEAS
ncbi:MAG: pantetheine-phosphate adenylyltransferase [Candidatus Eremiobacteraeota bacterium]|nr:pantetheine-phosphate adenylyltransferase [Candidatus Eremiobacteraeota bacterium]